MTMADVYKKSQQIATRYHQDSGVPCAVRVLAYDSTTKTRGPDYSFAARNVPFNIASISTITDPTILNRVRALNIDQTRYRLLTCPQGLISVPVQKDDRILKEPAVVGQVDTYQVIEALAPDESTRMEMVFHCQLISRPGS